MGIEGYLKRTSRTANALLLILPWILIYNGGAWLSDFTSLSGADLITPWVVKTWGRLGFAVYTAVIVVGVLVAAWRARGAKAGRLRPADALAVTGESAAYAAVVGGLVIHLLRDVPPVAIGLSLGHGSHFDVVMAAAGAGVHEEILFRLGLLSAIVALMEAAVGEAPFVTPLFAVVVSSVLFSLAHYLGPEPFQVYSFLFRACAGALFGALFLVRGLAVAVYTHTLYDLVVFLL